jgi:hypothetical protein
LVTYCFGVRGVRSELKVSLEIRDRDCSVANRRKEQPSVSDMSLRAGIDEQDAIDRGKCFATVARRVDAEEI